MPDSQIHCNSLWICDDKCTFQELEYCRVGRGRPSEAQGVGIGIFLGNRSSEPILRDESSHCAQEPAFGPHGKGC